MFLFLSSWRFTFVLVASIGKEIYLLGGKTTAERPRDYSTRSSPPGEIKESKTHGVFGETPVLTKIFAAVTVRADYFLPFLKEHIFYFNLKR